MTDQILEETYIPTPPTAMNVDVEVKPLKKHKKQLACAIGGPGVDGGTIELSKGDPHVLTFQLVSSNVSGLSFVADADRPFCSSTDGCPGKDDDTGQFHDAKVSSSGQRLTVMADASAEPIVHYALRFKDSSGAVVTCDPIIINQ